MASKALENVQEEVKADMTPMIDCVFLLIIFFLCIDFKILEAKLPAYLPKDSGAQKTQAEPIEKLSLKIECLTPGKEVARPNSKTFYREGHRVRFHVGPTPVNDEDALVKELRRIYNDRTKWTKDEKTGQPKPQPVVIEPGVNAVYGDVAVVVDAARNVGFDDIQFGGGMGRGNKGGGKGPAK
jgi:biopolymer transport protein ExbD